MGFYDCHGDQGLIKQDRILARLRLLKELGHGTWKEESVGQISPEISAQLGAGRECTELHWECLVAPDGAGRCEDIPPVNLAYKNFPIWYPDYELVLAHYQRCHPDLYTVLVLADG